MIACPVMSCTSEVVRSRSRIYYLDNLRTFLTLLVVIHHCVWVVIAGWFPFHRPWTVDTPTLVLGFMLTSGNQAYFMGLFFFLAGYLTGPSIKRKGSWSFLKDRFLRLMVPAIVYDIVLNPLLFCFVQASWYGRSHDLPKSTFLLIFEDTTTPAEVLSTYFSNFGDYVFRSNHMWFTATLFAINLLCVALIECVPTWKAAAFRQSLPSEPKTNRSIFLILAAISFGLVILNFLLRITTSDGYLWLPIVGNVGFIMQYIGAFLCGILANSYQFLQHLSKEQLPIFLVLSVILYLLFQTFQTFLIEFFRSNIGFYGLTFGITLFEQFFAVFWSYSLLVLFKIYQNGEPSKRRSSIIASAYATYIVHQWIIIPIAVGLAYTEIFPIFVVLILVILASPLSWCIGILLKRIPGSSLII